MKTIKIAKLSVISAKESYISNNKGNLPKKFESQCIIAGRILISSLGIRHDLFKTCRINAPVH